MKASARAQGVCVWLLAALLAGCASAPAPTVEAEVAQHPAPGGKPGQVQMYAGTDGRSLAHVVYARPGTRVALVYLHGIESHAGWFAIAAPDLHERGFDVYCLDRRGSGLNRENRGFVSGHVDTYETLLGDVDALVQALRRRYERVYLVGLSWGGKLALAYGLSHPTAIDGLVLITPGLRAKVDLSAPHKLKIALLTPINPTARVKVPITAEMFTTTPVYLNYIRNDPLRLSSATVGFFWQSRRLDRFIDENIGSIRLPVQLFLAGNDPIIDNAGVLSVLERGGSSGLEVLRYEEQIHSLQLDASQRLVEDISAWLERRASAAINTDGDD
jgi:alpha-beta hydrolase superfamily lysophospholipase